jgi:hypothetical protein
LLWLLSVTVAHAQNLPSAKPEEVGLSSERLNRALAAVKADVDKGALPGAVLLVARHGKVVMFDAVGVLDPATKGAHDQGSHLSHLLHEQAYHLGGGDDALRRRQARPG